MEIAGLAVGTLALVGVFEDCVRLFSQIGAAKSMEKDYTLLATRLDLQKALLLQWAERMNIYDEELCDPRLSDPVIGSLVLKTLDCIRKLLEDGDVLQGRYGVTLADTAEEAEPSTAASNGLMLRLRNNSLALRLRRDVTVGPSDRSKSVHQPSDGNRMAKRPRADVESLLPHDEALHQQRPRKKLDNKQLKPDSRIFRPFQVSVNKGSGETSNLDTIKWVIKDKEKFDILVRELSAMIADIDKLFPPQGCYDSRHTILGQDFQALKSIPELKDIMHASVTDNNELISITKRAIYTRLILDRLWFRLIDDREHNIADAHSRTLGWSIQPPTSGVAWDDLGRWLRSGRDTYWIYGKPGSGKSTLMKFLFNHPKVTSSLQEWAGERKLTVASFFLWNIGSIEQSSQEGLARGLLYHVLSENPELTPVILPTMWQETRKGVEDLSLPTNSEIRMAFQRLGANTTTGAFAFFIDGLDEFTGNHRDGISFVKNFITSANIKILVSSRPIDSCVAAFSSSPKLRLQDLTKPDIENYINDILRSHPYVCESGCLSEATIEELVQDIQSKASGVFLWVVLACRAMIEGFEAYDDAEELRRRIDELPPELERLFLHILSGLPSRFLQQAAKLLRICYTSRRLQIESKISAFRLAWAHEKDMKPHALEEFIPVSREKRKTRCTMLDGRLRSRCRGLLEVSTPNGHSNKSLSVDFMHRTVFEFLSTPAVWEMDCLQIDDHDFDANTVLAYMSCYGLYFGREDDENKVWIVSKYLQEVERSSFSNLTGLLNRFAETFERPENIPFSPFGPDSPLTETALLLAIELDLTTFVQSHDLRRFNALRERHILPSSSAWDPLYHAFHKPITFTARSIKKGCPCSTTMVDVLISAGCDPNKRIVLTGKDMRTCWTSWIKCKKIADDNKGSIILDYAEVTMIMIRAGAYLVTPGCRGPEAQPVPLVTERLTELVDKWLKFANEHGKRKRLRAVCHEIKEAVAASHEADNS